MKTIYKALLTLLVSFALLPSALAQVPQKAFAATASGTTNATIIISAFSINPGPARCEFLSCTSDLASAVCQFYTSTPAIPVYLTNNTTTIYLYPTNVLNTTVPATNALNGVTLAGTGGGGGGGGGIVVIRHVASDTYEWARLTTSTTFTNLVLDRTPASTVVPGDLIYGEIPGAQIAIPATLTTIGPAPAGIAYGTILATPQGGGANTPLLVNLTGTSNAKLNAVSGSYLP